MIPRSGGWTWGDWGENKDMTLLFNLWYVIALKGYEEMNQLAGEAEEAAWARTTADKLRKVFHRTFWNGNTTSLRAIRANPMTVRRHWPSYPESYLKNCIR